MDQNMNLHVDITGDSTSGVTSVEALNARLGALEQAYIRSQSASDRASHAFGKVGESAQKSGNLITRFTEDVTNHVRTTSIALNEMGLRSEAALVKMEGLTQLFKGMGGAVPGLLAVGGAITGIFAAFEVAKGAVEAAGQWQQRMALLGQTVRNQGGDWRTLSSAVQDWANLQEKTTIFSRDDAVSALETLTATGMKLNDAMIVTRVAEDAAAATGRNLTEINFALSEAMHGRTQALTLLGIGTRQSIHDGMTFAQILTAIEKNMGGEAAAAADTWTGKLAQLHNTIDTLRENIGIRLLPYMSKFVDVVKDWVDEVDKDLPNIEQKFLSFYKSVKSVVDFIKQHQGEVDFFFGTVIAVTAVKALNNARLAFIALRDNMITSETWLALRGAVQEAALVFGLEGGGLVGGLRAATVAFRGLQAAEAGATLGISLFIGWLADGHFGQAVDFATNAIGKLINAYGQLTLMIGRITGNSAFIAVGQGAIDAANKAAAGSHAPKFKTDPFSWATMWGHKKSSDAGISGLSSDLASEMVGGKLGGDAQAKKNAAADLAESIRKLTDEYKHGKITLDQYDAALNKIAAEHPDNHALVDHITDLERAAAEATTKLGKLHKAVVDIYSIGNPFKKYILDNPLAQSAATSGLLNQTTTQEMDILTGQINNSKEADQQRAEALKKWEQYYKSLEENAKQWTDRTAGWIEEMFSRGKKGVNSFAETFKNILKEIEQALLKSALFEFFMGAQGAKGQSFGSIFASYMGFGSHSSGSSGGNRTPNSSGGIIGSLIGTSSATQLASSLPTDSLMSLMFGVGAPSATNDSGAAGAISGAAAVIAGAGGPGGGTNAGYASLLGNNSGNIASLLGTSGGQAAAGIALAVGFGDAFAALIHGGNNNGSTYGTWGMIGGLLAGIPGAIIGSLFGHKDNPANMPDKYNTTDFGQIVANLTGAGGGQYHSTDPTAPASHNWFGANGQKFFSNIGSLTGGGSGIGWIEETLAKYANPDGSMGPNTPDWLKPMWSQLVSAFGISASGSGQLNFGHNIGQEWVTGAQGASSNPTSYTNLGDLMNQFIQNYLTQGSVGVNPYSPPGNNGSGFNVSSPFAGAYMVGTPGSTPTLVNGAPSFNMGSDPNAPGRVTMPVSTQPITVNVTVQGNVTAENNLADTIKQRIEEHIIRGHIGNSMALGGVGF